MQVLNQEEMVLIVGGDKAARKARQAARKAKREERDTETTVSVSGGYDSNGPNGKVTVTWKGCSLK